MWLDDWIVKSTFCIPKLRQNVDLYKSTAQKKVYILNMFVFVLWVYKSNNMQAGDKQG